MASRTQIRLPQLSGSIADGGAALSQVGTGGASDSLKQPIDAMASAIKRITGKSRYFMSPEGVFTHTRAQFTGSVQSTTSLRTQNGEFRAGSGGDDGVLVMQAVGADANFQGHIQVGTNDIKDSGGNDHIVFTAGANGLTEVVGQLKITGEQIQAGGGSAVAQFTNANHAFEIVNDLVVSGNIVSDANESKEIFDAVTSNPIRVGGGGLVHVGKGTAGDVQLFGTSIKNRAGDNAIVLGTAGTNVTVDLGLGSGLVSTAAKLKVGGNAIQNSAGGDLITFNATGNEVTIPGDLKVGGEVTALDTDNLLVKDKIIGLNFGSGSNAKYPAANGQVAMIFGQAAGTTHKALWYDQGTNNQFNFVNTLTSPASSSVTLAAGGQNFVNVAMADLYLSGTGVAAQGNPGGAIYNVARQKAIQLDDSASAPLVSIMHNGELFAGKTLSFNSASAAGNPAAGGSIKFDITGNPNPDGLQLDVAADQIFRFAVGAQGVVEISEDANQQQIALGRTGRKAVVQGVNSQNLVLRGGDDIMFHDSNVAGSTWGDAVDGIKLTTNQGEWNAYVTKFSNSKSILGALVDAANSSGDALAGKKVKLVTANYTAGSQFDIDIDLDDAGTPLSAADVEKRLDVYVNGQLLTSSSADGSSNMDYQLFAGPSGATDLIIRFDMIDGDIVTAVIR